MVLTGLATIEGLVSSFEEVLFTAVWPQTSGRSSYTGRTEIATLLYAAS